MVTPFFFLLLAWRFTSVTASVFNCVGGSVYIVAHPDDDLLFQSPDLLHDVQAGNCITGVYLTSGDSGYGSAYAQSREAGNEAAWAQMAGVADSYTEFNASFGGQPLLVRTLVGAPQIQKIFFRLPDGAVDGSGYGVTGYMSLRDLYFGVIGSIINQPGTATYTLATLQQAIAEILTARQPDQVRSLDHLSDFDAGDHSDHLTAGRLTKEMADSYAPSANHTGYIGYPNLAPTLTIGSADLNGKNDAFFTYSPYDSGECQSFDLCKSAGRGEYFWLLRQYAITPDLAETSTIGTAQTQAIMPTGGSNVANVSTVTASSVVSGQPAFAAIDGNIGGYPGNSSAEWVAVDSSLGTTFLMDWGEDTYNITSVVLYDRPNTNDWITGGTLTFSDDSSISFGSLYNDGSATVINLDPTGVLTTSILLTITSLASSTSQSGLSEFQVYGIKAASNATSADNFSAIDIALNATATASSESSSTGQTAQSAIDGYISGYKEDGSGTYWEEWASGTTVGTTLTLTWDSAVSIARVILYDRPNLSDQITGGTLTYDDGSSTKFSALVNSGSATYVDLASPINSTSLVLTVTSVSSTSSSAGLAEIQVYGVPGSNTADWLASSETNSTSATALPSSGVDLALNATAVASSQSDSTGQTASAAIDGYVSGYKEDGSGTYWEEWASGTTVGTTLTLTWSSPINISQVVLYDRPNLSDQITGGTLAFEDGSSITFGALVNDGSATYVNLTSAVTTSSLLLTVTSVSSSTTSAGLAEIEVFGWGSASSNTSDPDPTSGACSTGSFATDLALNATAVASSESSGSSQTADKAIDGEISGYMEDGTGTYSEEWASGAGVGTTLTLSWTEAITVQQVILYDRPNLSDQITAGTLTFDDGSSVSFGSLENDGSATCVNLTSSVNTTSILMTVTKVSSTTTSAGLAEIQVYGQGNSGSGSTTTPSTPALASSGVDLALNATAVASSQSDSTGQTASAAIDGYVDGYKEDGSGTYWEEWASGTTVGTTLTLTWSSAINITQVVLYDRPNLSDQITGGTLAFDDGSSVTFGALVNDGSATYVNLTSAVTTSSLLLTVTSVSSSTSSAGLAEIEVFGWGDASSNTSDPDPTSGACSTGSFATDLALNATAVASSESSGSSQTADKAIDGEISGYMEDGTGTYWEEWASGAGVGTTLTLSWTEAITVQQVILYDRPNLSDQITAGTLTFDDGSSVSFGALENDGSATCVNLTTSVNTSSILLTVTDVSSTTTSAGLAEFQVYGDFSSDTTNATSTITSSVPSATANSTVGVNSTLSVNGSSTLTDSVPVSTAFNFSSTITSHPSVTSTSLFPSSTDFNSTSTDGGNATATSSGLLPAPTDLNSTTSNGGNGTETSTSLPVSTAVNSTSSALPSSSTNDTSSSVPTSSTAVNSTSSALPTSSTAINSTSSALPASSTAVNSTSSALPTSSLASSTGSNSTSALPSSTTVNSTITSTSSTASSQPSSASSSTLNASQSSASASSASSASRASASSASAASASSSRAAASSAASSASVASVSSASASKASASMASVSQASLSSASVASASSSRAAASSQSVAQASASRASVSSASLASVSSASAASVSSASASKASVSAASVSSASVASASRASVASASSASAAATKTTSMVTVTRTSTSATQTSTAKATAAPQATSVNIAALGTATASSFRASSPPSGVNDGNVGGLSLLGLGTASQEWSTGSSATPAWVQIDFKEYYLMKTVYLYAPVNTLNTITGGTLTLSDGSSIAVNSVSSSGTAVSLGSAGKTISWLRFTITKTGLLNSAVGLAEIRAYNSAAKTSCSLLDLSCLINAVL